MIGWYFIATHSTYQYLYYSRTLVLCRIEVHLIQYELFCLLEINHLHGFSATKKPKLVSALFNCSWPRKKKRGVSRKQKKKHEKIITSFQCCGQPAEARKCDYYQWWADCDILWVPLAGLDYQWLLWQRKWATEWFKSGNLTQKLVLAFWVPIIRTRGHYSTVLRSCKGTQEWTESIQGGKFR